MGVFKEYKEKCDYYINYQDEVKDILNAGVTKAQTVAAPMMEKIRTASRY